MIIADTGFWVALVNKKDANYFQAKRSLARLQEPLITTWPVVVETSYLLYKRVSQQAQHQFIDSIAAGKFQIFKIKVGSVSRISQLMKQYADLPMDLADASLVVLAEHLGNGRILSADWRNFNTYRWNDQEPFENLMFPT